MVEWQENAEAEIQPSTDEMHATVVRQSNLAIGERDVPSINKMKAPKVREHPFVVVEHPWQEESVRESNEETSLLLAHPCHDAFTFGNVGQDRQAFNYADLDMVNTRLAQFARGMHDLNDGRAGTPDHHWTDEVTLS